MHALSMLLGNDIRVSYSGGVLGFPPGILPNYNDNTLFIVAITHL